MRPLRVRALLALVAVATVVPATVAAAHPALRPDELRPGETVEAELIVPHGCGNEGGMPEEGEVASPTVEIAVQWPDGIEIWPEEVDGWSTDVADGVATWLDDGGATTDAILVPTTVSATTDVAGDVLVPVFQACENGESFRWVAAPGEDGSPALRLTVTGDPVPATTPSVPPAATPAATPSDAATATAPVQEVAASATPAAATATPAPTPDEQEDAERASAFLVLALGLAVGVGIATFVIRRRRAGTTDVGASGTGGTDAGGGQ